MLRLWRRQSTKGRTPGLFKHLIDLPDPQALVHKPIPITTTGGGDYPALAIEYQLRPLFAFFDADTLGTAVHVFDKDFDEGRLTSRVALARLTRAVLQFHMIFP